MGNRLGHDNDKTQKLVDRSWTETLSFLWLTFSEDLYAYTMQVKDFQIAD